MVEHVSGWIEYTAVAVEAATAGVIAFAVVEALWRTVRRPRARLDARLHLGRWLALALEFALAADILRTAVAPSWDEIGQLGAIAALRTALNFFLEREIRHGESVQAALR